MPAKQASFYIFLTRRPSLPGSYHVLMNQLEASMSCWSRDRTPAIFAGNNPASRRDPLRVVVADDTPHMLEAIAAVMEIQGGAEIVAKATNGIAAISAACALRPDLVVLDVSMPLMNGLEALLHIKRRLPETRVLIVSAEEDWEIVQCAFDCGADGFVWKGEFFVRCREQIQAMFADRFVDSDA
jgi:CheY-like chemotaxis protein